MLKAKSIRPSGHVLLPAVAIGALSLALAAGLEALQMPNQADRLVAEWLGKGAAQSLLIPLPIWMIWLPTAAMAFLLPLAILSVPGTWRRVLLWITSIVLMASWAPVLYLASRLPEVASPLIVTIWSGVCALVYTGNHRMPCDADSLALMAETTNSPR